MGRADNNRGTFRRIGAVLFVLAGLGLLAQPASGTVTFPFTDQFDTAPSPEWSFTPASAWSTSGGTLNLSNATGGVISAAAVELDSSIDLARTGISMSVDFNATSMATNADIGFGVFGDTPNYVLGGDGHYLADLKPSGAMRILRVSDATPLSFSTLISLTGLYTFSAAETYGLAFEMFPTAGTHQLRLTIDDPSRGAPLTLSVTDSSLLSGRYFGIRNRDPATATFDDFALTALVAPQKVYNFDWGPNNGTGKFTGLAAALDSAGTPAVWSQSYNGGDNAVTDSFGNASNVKVWLESAYNFGTRATDWDTDTTIGGTENHLQGDLFWVAQGGLDAEAAGGGNGLYDIVVKGLDPEKVYDLYVYGGGDRGTTVTLDDETYTMTGSVGNPASSLAWAESRHFVAFRGLSGFSEYALGLGVAPGSSSLGFSGLQVILVPEPASVTMLGFGVLCLLLVCRRRS